MQQEVFIVKLHVCFDSEYLSVFLKDENLQSEMWETLFWVGSVTLKDIVVFCSWVLKLISKIWDSGADWAYFYLPWPLFSWGLW